MEEITISELVESHLLNLAPRVRILMCHGWLASPLYLSCFILNRDELNLLKAPFFCYAFRFHSFKKKISVTVSLQKLLCQRLIKI